MGDIGKNIFFLPKKNFEWEKMTFVDFVVKKRYKTAGALQKPMTLGHSHASMATTLALHGFAGRRLRARRGGDGRLAECEHDGRFPPSRG